MRTTLVTTALALAACGDPASTSPDASKLADAPKQIDAAVDAPPAMHQGFVTLEKGSDANGASSSMSASFTDTSPFGTVIGTDALCTAFTPASSGARYSAGTIDVTGATTALTLTPSGTAPSVRYLKTPDPIPKDLFSAGASLGIHAAGGADFVTFSATVTAPAPVAGFTPPTALSRAGYTATWTAGSGAVWVIVLGISGNTGTTLLCKVPDSGSYTVSPASFALLPTTATSGTVVLARVTETTVATASGPVLVAIAADIQSGLIPINP